jgi:hypothetical protein
LIAAQSGLDRLWVADITYVAIAVSVVVYVYVAVILDA